MNIFFTLLESFQLIPLPRYENSLSYYVVNYKMNTSQFLTMHSSNSSKLVTRLSDINLGPTWNRLRTNSLDQTFSDKTFIRNICRISFEKGGSTNSPAVVAWVSTGGDCDHLYMHERLIIKTWKDYIHLRGTGAIVITLLSNPGGKYLVKKTVPALKKNKKNKNEFHNWSAPQKWTKMTVKLKIHRLFLLLTEWFRLCSSFVGSLLKL